MYVHLCHGVHVTVTGHLAGVYYLLPLYEF